MAQLTPVPALAHPSLSEHPPLAAQGGRPSASARDIPSVRAVYLKAAPSPVEGHRARLILVFLAVFVLTTLGVLGAWAALHLLARLWVEPAPRVELVRALHPVPVPVPVLVDPPVSAGLSATGRIDPPSAPAPSAASGVASPPPPEVAPPEALALPPHETSAEEWIEAVPFVLSVLESERPAAALEPAPIPEAARALAGTWMGKGDGRPLSLELAFLPDGLLRALVRRSSGEGRLSVEASGTWELQGQTATIVLMERGVPAPVAYSGTVSKTRAEGRMTQAGRNLGRFSVER